MRYIFYFLLSLFFISCESKQDYKMGYSGALNEVVVVTSQEQWSGKIGQTIQKYFADYATVLPQPERKFWIINVDDENFGSLFQTHRNVVYITIDKKKKTALKFKKSHWAKEQLVCEITAPSEENFVQLMNEKGEEIVNMFHKAEVERQIAKNKKFGSKSIPKTLYEKHKLKIIPQEGAKIEMDSSNFVWIGLEREQNIGGYDHQITQGVLIYYYPYSDTSQLNPRVILAVKDSVTKKYIAGPSDGSYMAVSKRGELPQSKSINFKGSYAVEIKGLWRMENNFMGGPFISLTTIDTLNNRVVTAEGFVFAPQFKKRDYLLEIEAMVKSLSFQQPEH